MTLGLGGQPHHATCVMLGRRAVLIEGAPGAGKSSLALALIDRGGILVGDDGVLLDVEGAQLLASPHPNIAGKLEVRNLGIIEVPSVVAAPVALVIALDMGAPRFISAAETAIRAGCPLPLVRLYPDTPVLALRAELALRQYGLPED
ncbi:HPr kinase/phosphatase C-terminal domain-containing protein [Novosphingobium sp. KCTC 2891]|uniref:HPr kinase/phosphorylase n=1 Tax=Novosphingobium sp. KCTC 2891 TaxID=2989730 RepID=UPI002222A937|nr:HPr kinase/phosphatase C-terminal domain-containing protein [Novosphingobium sp. KCTC 2891]MCW1382454.1 HPr kinase/phosphatase C-terminal domain-containing protein [Novosphingobium sp. KCTC 2891]